MSLPRARGALLLGLLSLLGPGCVAQVVHEPNGALVDRMGDAGAQRLLVEVLGRMRSPKAEAVEVEPAAVGFRVNTVGWAAFGALMVDQSRVRIPFQGIARVDIYENGRAFLFDATERKVLRLDFASVEDACAFADLLASFKVRPPRSYRPRKRPAGVADPGGAEGWEQGQQGADGAR